MRGGKYLIFLCAFSLSAQARKNSFTEPHKGLTLGGGTYFHVLPNDNKWDVSESLETAATKTSGTSPIYLIPLRIGWYKETPVIGSEVYYRRLTNSPKKWTTTGEITGTGITSYTGNGAGWTGYVRLWGISWFRVSMSINTEYMFHAASVKFSAENVDPEELNVTVSNLLFGGGFEPEIYIGDNWALKLHVGYQYGMAGDWTVPKGGGKAIGRTYAEGTLKDPIEGSAVQAQFGGLLVEASLRLMAF